MGPIVEAGEPAARIYKHSDGYPKGILPLLNKLENVLRKNLPLFGSRLDDPEWAAAEFISMFRLSSAEIPQNSAGSVERNGQRLYGGNVYVSQQIHPDIEYLYRVICKTDGWNIRIFKPKYGDKPGFDIVGFEEVAK